MAIRKQVCHGLIDLFKRHRLNVFMLLMESIFTSGIILFLLYKDVSVVRNSSPATFCSRKVDGNGYSVSTRIIASEVTQSDSKYHSYVTLLDISQCCISRH